ncbi:Predicted arabinose efflux permease, MFS family [Friedmanniella luteola]|uniref:Predicted arabinose efflux permease, MFS family n=1 Tax=Friedmanniella luteola TaxID=546871 RepID=A0A1H1PHP1_9ACTN|nr:MFS transporter [Friedmanniella luteola]SDS10633.1 Predicted arabinose efflux permease, MFS family [Friedmanniella luteola]
MSTLSPTASFWTAAGVAGLALWASGAPTVVYPLYAQAWHLAPATTTLIFAVYPLVLIPVLLLFGNLSDVLGRRLVILLGLGVLALGSLTFALAGDLGWVLVARALMGVGVGLSLSPATAAVAELEPSGRPGRASAVTTAATATGLALATLVGGALVEHAPSPRHLTFGVLLLVTLVTAGAAWFLPGPVTPATERWRPRRPHVPAGARRLFSAGTLAVSGAYALGAVYLALGAQIARDLVGSTDALVSGAIISVSAVVIGVVALLARNLAPRRALVLGPPAALLGLGLLLVAANLHTVALFLASSVVVGAGYSLLFSGGLGLVTASAPGHHRAGVLSAAYTVGYLVQAVAALGLGLLATGEGLLRALEIGTPAVGALAVGAAVLAVGRRPGLRRA